MMTPPTGRSTTSFTWHENSPSDAVRARPSHSKKDVDIIGLAYTVAWRTSRLFLDWTSARSRRTQRRFRVLTTARNRLRRDRTMIDESPSSPPNLDFTRRGFVMTSLAAGFALSAQPVSAQTISTDTKGLEAGEVKIPVSDGEVPAYRACPRAADHFRSFSLCRRSSACTSISRIYAVAWPSWAIWPSLPNSMHPGRRFQDHEFPGNLLESGFQGPRQAGDVGPRRSRCLGQGDRQGRCCQAGYYRLLLGWANRLALFGP